MGTQLSLFTQQGMGTRLSSFTQQGMGTRLSSFTQQGMSTRLSSLTQQGMGTQLSSELEKAVSKRSDAPPQLHHHRYSQVPIQPLPPLGYRLKDNLISASRNAARSTNYNVSRIRLFGNAANSND